MNAKGKPNTALQHFRFLLVFLVIGALSQVAHAGLVWDDGQRMPGQLSIVTPTLVTFNNNLYCVHVSSANKVVVIKSSDGQNWGGAYYIPGQLTAVAPAPVVFNNKLYCLHKANSSGKLVAIASSNGLSWGSAYYMGNLTTSAAPAAAAFNNRLYCVYKDETSANRIYVSSSSDGTNWAAPYAIPGQTTSDGPALAVFSGRLYCVYKDAGAANRIYVTSSADGQNWNAAYFIPIQTTSATPSLSVLGDKLYCLFKGTEAENKIRVVGTEDGQTWADSGPIPDENTSAAPASAHFNGRVYCAYKANNATTEVYFSDAEEGILTVLDVNLYAQQTSMWCWAASGEMIMNYLGNNVAQCTQANNRFGRNDCCNNFQNCVIGGWPQFDRYNFNSLSAGRDDPLTFQQLKTEFDNSRPVGFTWYWINGGGHYMVARGVYQNDNGEQFVHINDPWPWNADKNNGGDARLISYAEYCAAADHGTWQNDYDITEN